MKSAYKSIFLDLDNTLLDFSLSQKHALTTTFQAAGLDAFPEIISHYERINHSLWQLYEKGSLRKEDVLLQRWQGLFRQYGISRVPEEINKVYLNELAEKPIWLTGAEDFFIRIAENHRIVIVTNGDGKTARRRMELAGILNAVQAVVVSEEVGVAKPHKLIFQHAMDAAETTSKQEVLMIGDNFHADIMGAENFGIDAWWYNPSGRERPSGNGPRYESDNHHDIAAYLS
jgi:2-haloacid dehalogenase